MQQRDSRHWDADFWIAGIVTPPNTELVASPVDNNPSPPAFDQAVMNLRDLACGFVIAFSWNAKEPPIGGSC